MTSPPREETIESPAEFVEFERTVKRAARDEIKLSKSELKRTLRLLFAVVCASYGSSIAIMAARSRDAGENARCSTATTEVAKTFNWSQSTTRKYFWAMKTLFAHLAFDEGFVRTFRVMRAPETWNRALPKKYGVLNGAHPVRERLETWTQAIRENSRNRSDEGVRNMIAFYLSTCLPRLGLDVGNLQGNQTTRVQVQEKLRETATVESICGARGGKHSSRKARWLQLLVQDVLATDAAVPNGYLKKHRVWSGSGENDDGSDKHRICARDLDAIYEESTKDPKNELLFLLMITTGLRIGAVSRIQTRHVADIEDNRYKVKAHGRTKEKGDKWVSFMLTKRVQELVLEWLTKRRAADLSPHLFPGRSGCIATETIRTRFGKLCKARNLSGKEFHPHALRHSYAHILLETGNSVDVVSKCLNHSTSAVTEQFYLKESAVEVNSRANIPWMRGADDKKRNAAVVPQFLGGAAAESTTHSRSEAKRRRINSQMQALEAFTFTPLLPK